MTSPTRRISTLALLALAGAFLPACGAGGATTNRYAGACVDHQGFPVPCDTPGAMPAHKPGAEELGFALNRNTQGVSDASGDLATFAAAEPHTATLAGLPAADLTLGLDGRLRGRGLPVGWAVYAQGEQGDLVAVLVDDEGRLLDLVPAADGLAVLRTASRPRLAAPGQVPASPETQRFTTLPVALPELPTAHD